MITFRLKLATVLLLTLIASGLIAANNSFTQTRYKHIMLEQYQQSNEDPIMMFGFSVDTFFTQNWYYTLGVHEAIGGNRRAGYAALALGLGYNYRLADKWGLDAAYWTGAGGGGRLKRGVGGGSFHRIKLGLTYDLTPDWRLSGYWSYMDFPDGFLATNIIGLGIAKRFTTTRFAPNVKRQNMDLPKDAKTRKHRITMETKTWTFDPRTNEQVTLFGARTRTYITNNWYWGEAGYAAVIGERHGYIEVQLVGGYEYRWWQDRLFIDWGAMIGGAGGGGDYDLEGNGLAIQTLLQLGINITKHWNIAGQIGYMDYINGEIDSTMLGLSAGYTFEIFE